MTDYQDILYEVKDRVALITLNRPDRLNAWTGAMEHSVKRAITDAVADESVRVIVLTGAGRGFCAGADMSMLQEVTPAGLDESSFPDGKSGSLFDQGLGPDVSEYFARGRFGYLMDCPKPVIAAINGPAAGMGLVFALHCDMRFAGTDAKFTTAFAQRGLIAEHGISWILPKIVGPGHAMDLLLSARKVGGEEAERIGLVNRCFPQESFLDATLDYAKLLANTVSPRSMTVMKRQVWKAMFDDYNRSAEIGDDEMQASFSSEDFKEGVAHFVEKRAANFTGR